MKKWIIFISVYSIFLWIPIHANNGNIKYQIYMDSLMNNSYELKEEVIEIIDYLCSNLNEGSFATMIDQNLSVFEKIDHSVVSWKNNTLIIKVGNAKGTYLKGEYEQSKICIKEVKPKSKVKEWLGI